jgi:hypothetical protein
MRVLVGEHVAFVGENVIPVVQSQRPGIAPGNVRHQ